MANIDIDTTSAQYVNMMTFMGNLRTYIGPKVKLYVRISDDKQKQWRDADPLLKEVFRLVRDINKADARAEEVDT